MLCGWCILRNGCPKPVLLVNYWLTEDEGTSLHDIFIDFLGEMYGGAMNCGMTERTVALSILG